ncbi:MAG: hypothetical protein ABFD89_28435, partial [Bryobacteraceae bacterium]
CVHPCGPSRYVKTGAGLGAATVIVTLIRCAFASIASGATAIYAECVPGARLLCAQPSIEMVSGPEAAPFAGVTVSHWTRPTGEAVQGPTDVTFTVCGIPRNPPATVWKDTCDGETDKDA